MGAIIRNDVGDYQRSNKKRQPKVQRKAADHDLAWCTNKVYVLDEHEWFDPCTSSKYHNGVSRHAMYGPSVITVSENGGGTQTNEAYVNDPQVWAWIRRSIAEGLLAADTQHDGINAEQDIVFRDELFFHSSPE